MHEFQLFDQDTSGPARRQDEPDSDGRKRRRLIPITVAADQLPRDVEAEVGRLSEAFDTESPAEPGAWDHLNKWIQADDSIVEDLEEEEVEYSDVSDEALGLAEGSEDGSEDTSLPVEGLTTRPSKLGADTVIEIIQSCIESYELAWTPGKGETQPRDGGRQGEVPVVYDPLAMWEEAEAAGQRDELAKKYESEAQYYRQRLDRLCDEIVRDPGNTATGIRMVSYYPSTNFIIVLISCIRCAGSSRSLSTRFNARPGSKIFTGYRQRGAVMRNRRTKLLASPMKYSYRRLNYLVLYHTALHHLRLSISVHLRTQKTKVWHQIQPCQCLCKMETAG